MATVKKADTTPAANTKKTASKAKSGTKAVVNNNQQVRALESKRLSLAERYKREPKVAVAGSPFYRPYFGNNMPIILNGIAIHVPMNGQQYNIPESFAAEFNGRIKRIDAQRQVEQRLGNISANLESYAGEKDLISPV